MRPGPLLLGLYAAAVYAFIFAPVVVLALFSFQDSRLPIPPFDGPSLRWYREVLADPRLTAGLANSLIVAAGSAAAATLLGFLAAWGLARRLLPGEAALRALLVAPLTVSYLVIGLGLLATFNAVGVPRSLVTVAIGHVVINLPLAFAILYASLGPRIRSAERAARDLGAGEARVLVHVTAPMLAPALAASFFLAFTFSWDEFIIAFLLARFEVTLPVEIWSLLRSGLDPKTNAVGSIVFLVSVALVLALELALLRRRPG
jgi:spermidine/putrescine transport system permease protein